MKNAVNVLKIIGMIATVLVSILAILYILDIFSAEAVKDAIIKSIAVSGILAVASLVIVLISSSKSGQ